MGLFNKFKEGGVMDTIKCDGQDDYLIWKWRPNADLNPNQSRKETSIRSGSSLYIKPGQAAIFLYPKGGCDVIIGPYNDRITTDNMPVLSGLVGALFAGGTPFPAEVYFINQQADLDLPFFVEGIQLVPPPSFDMPGFNRNFFDLKVNVKGVLTYEVPRDNEKILNLVRAFGGVNTPKEDADEKIRRILPASVGEIVAQTPTGMGIGLMELETRKSAMGAYILSMLKNPASPKNLEHRFGIELTGVEINRVEYNEDSSTYAFVKKYYEGKQQNVLFSVEGEREMMATDLDVRNATARMTAGIQMEHMQDTMARQREEGQFAQHSQTIEAARQARLGTESAFINAHALDQQTEVMKTGLENMGSMGAMNLGGGDGHMNPAGMMTGMMMGSAVAGQMGQMMGQMGGLMQQNMASAGQPQQAPPPIPGSQPQATAFYLHLNNQQYGPVGIENIAQLVSTGQVTKDTLAWCEGMSAWAPAKNIPALQGLFAPPAGSVPPATPPVPPIPPVNP
jgi:membrane protease subunit (stomatin/prohibitin family)